MSKDRYPYPPDEFDAVDPTSRPAGAHLAPPSPWSKVWPYLVVLVVAPLVGFGAIQLLSHYQQSQDTPPSAGAAVTSTAPAGDATDTTPTDGQTTPEETAPTQTAPPETTPSVNMDARVICFNASHVAGVAQRCSDKLTAAGFSDGEFANYEGTNRTPPTAVYYGDEALAATAQQVATTLGIATVEQNADELGPGDIAVVLRTDYKES